jgi:hypothetical protein
MVWAMADLRRNLVQSSNNMHLTYADFFLTREKDK